jgi:predicted N-acyltransferase
MTSGSDLQAIGAAAWKQLNPSARLDHSHEYLCFRECVEPGAPVVATVDDASGLRGAVWGALTAPGSAMFSHPWKLLSDEQFLRAEPDEPGPRDEQVALVRAIARGPAGQGGGLAGQLHKRIGDALVVRLFDTSELILRPDLSEEGRAEVADSLVAQLQERVAAGLAGAVAFPYVHPADHVLRAALARRGFRWGRVTATSVIELPPVRTYDELIASFSKSLRRRYLKEERALAASGLEVTTVSLADHLRRICELEAQTASAHGGTPDLDRTVEVRARMLQYLGAAVRVPAALADGQIVACGIDVTDASDYYGLVYGCDYSVPERSTAYMCIVFYEPIRYCIARGLRRLRMGFEAFEPKLLRGAVVTPRETWVWTPDEEVLDGLSALLEFLTARADSYVPRLRPSRGFGRHPTWSASGWETLCG